MKLALLIGPKGNEIKPKLMSVKDNLNIDVYKSVPEFMDIAIKKGTIYDRVLVLSTMLDETKINNLHSYWQSYCKDTEIIALCKKDKDEAMANVFISAFTSVNVAPMIVANTDLKTLAESILLSPIDINTRYGIPDYLNSDTMDDEVFIEEPEPEPEPEPEQVVEEPQQKQDENQPQLGDQLVNQPIQKKKGGLFSGLFGKKDKNKKQNNSAVQQQLTPPQTDLDNQLNQSSQLQSKTAQQTLQQHTIQSNPVNIMSNVNLQSEFTEVSQSKNSETITQQSSSFVDEHFDDDFEQPMQSVDNFEQPNSDDFSENVQNDSSSDFDETSSVDKATSGVDETRDDFVDDFSTDFSVQNDLEVDSEPDFGSMPVQREFKPVENISDDFASDVDDDSAFQIYKPSPSSNEVNNSDFIEEVEEPELNLEDVASAESAYREATQQTKVITNTVVKEVIRTVPADNTKGMSKATALKKVLDGQVNKTILVTGDRATGVTLTAYNLALKFAEKVPVLYVDFDTQTHGLLNYIDYGQWQSYDNIQIHGLKFCKNSRNFNNCIVRYADNLDILGSDFSSDVTIEELEQSALVVAENLGKYGVVIVDCPSYNIEHISELILTANTVMCVEGSKRGFMNMLCAFENSKLSVRYKRAIVNRGTMLVTKCNPKIDVKQLIDYINKIFVAEEVDWLSMDWAKFSGKFSINLLNSILEG